MTFKHKLSRRLALLRDASILTAFLVLIGLAACRRATENVSPDPTPEPVAAVVVSPASATIAVGSTASLGATPEDANGNPLSGRAVTWSSDNTATATVNASGLVRGEAAGAATITATSGTRRNRSHARDG